MGRYLYAIDFFVALVVLAVIADLIGNLILKTECGRRLLEWLFPDDE